jgi:hypothetical protein
MGGLKYNVAVRHPETLEAVVLKAGEEVPEWASGLISDEDLVSDGSAEEAPAGQGGPEKPAGNASTDEWAAYARAQGATDTDLAGDDGKPLGRDEIRAKYGD